MMRLAYRLAPLSLASLVLSLGVLFPAAKVEAQTKGKGGAAPPATKSRAAGEGQERLVLEKDWGPGKDGQDESKRFQEIRKGNAPANPAPELLDHAAQWYAYRLTHTEYQETKPSGKGMYDLVKEAVDQIVDLRDPKKPATRAQQDYMEEFGKRLAVRLQEVVKNPKTIARLNAAIILARLAAAGQEDAVDVLVEVIQDPKESDAVKLHALRGLKDLFASGRGESPFKKDKEREARAIAALLQYVGRKPTLPKDAPPEELAAVSYVRAEAVAALGQTRYPAHSRVAGKNTFIERQTALALLRVLRKDGLVPEPSLAEQVAAAVGVCQLQSKELDQYNADYAAYHLGRFIVDFISLHNSRAQQEKEKKEQWKMYAFRLSHALSSMHAELMNPPASDHAAYVAKMSGLAGPLLAAIQGSSTAYPPPTDLSAWLDQNPPKNRSVYKGVADAVVNEGERTAAN